MVRYRAKLVRLRSGLKAQVHAVMGKHGVLPARDDMFGPGGTAHLYREVKRRTGRVNWIDTRTLGP